MITASPSDTISFHFDVPNKMISANTLAGIAKGLEQITDTVFEETLEGAKKTEVYLCIPREGCFEAIFQVVVPVITGAFVSIASKSFINTFLKDMIGKDLSELSEFSATKLSDSLKENLLINYACTAISEYLDRPYSELQCRNNEDYLNKRLVVLKAKNLIYEHMEEDNRIKAVSYKGDDYIDREDFSKYIAPLPDNDDELCEHSFYHGKIKIISPVSLKEKSRRGWTCFFLSDLQNKTERTFEIDDDRFRNYAITQDIKLAADDIAEVQMIKDNELTPQWRVLRVLKFDGESISPPLTNEELSKLSIKTFFTKKQQQANLLDNC
ncbi:hypothetical protein [Pseudodesulfovibrio sp. zrk46]|uniref:hypothetical protein n=1 Tax=Pseudodesulfovibrio sp. zrk46 TaxID=2725288 RepID=UPI001448BF89|nr:hypothetical protein [Pseudodesulfovibrio sp. zrk46]QJB55156.1 hypothetical protein HFN16_01495 [Pseudodesulfovibrio sp. zrk46]